jgi:hypothetical protein
MAIGLCKLTGETGEFVNSHLYPAALTRPAVKGAPLIQSGEGVRPIRRWSSWSDRKLVTQKGEDILQGLDDRGIKELRRLKLIWSGWGPMTSLGALQKSIPETPWGARRVDVSDSRQLRLFFLSILWRAAATDRREFSEVALPEADLETLRKMLVSGDAGVLSFYPVQLTQLSTLGVIHNLSPFANDKEVPLPDNAPPRIMPIFRFYFDGLIFHVHRHASDDGYSEKVRNLMVGGDNSLIVSTVTYEESFQRRNFSVVMHDTYQNWPELMARLDR